MLRSGSECHLGSSCKTESKRLDKNFEDSERSRFGPDSVNDLLDVKYGSFSHFVLIYQNFIG